MKNIHTNMYGCMHEIMDTIYYKMSSVLNSHYFGSARMFLNHKKLFIDENNFKLLHEFLKDISIALN